MEDQEALLKAKVDISIEKKSFKDREHKGNSKM
jgi:hypothetical protein